MRAGLLLLMEWLVGELQPPAGAGRGRAGAD